jgi:LuxR family transcriptional regulator, maltose regulon positive regulatory protein
MRSHPDNELRPPLLRTKFFIPKPSQPVVTRPQLLTLLNRSLQLPLIVISAPAGFGKTTLVGEWIRNINLPTTWLSLDHGDDDPSCFFSYFIGALQQVNKSIGREIQNVLGSGQLPPVPFITASLINDILAADTPFILILDDFQEIQDPVIFEVLDTMLANPPKQLHLVLITREDPLLPLGRLRANNQMAEIRASDLRFSEAEVDQFLNGIMGLALSDEDIAALENRTEGWVAGIQLAAIAMYRRTDLSGFISRLSGSHRFIFSYLTEEVLSRQPEHIQLFLLQTSILDKLCAELCNAVTGHDNSQALLEKCVHANLFLVPLDDEGRWYRYHHLFRDLLLTQRSRKPQQDTLELHRRASRWYEGSGMIAESIEHTLVAADYGHAVQLLEDHARGMIMQGYLKTVEGWMQAIPSEWQSRNPRANLAFAWMHLMRGNYKSVAPYLKQAEEAISQVDPDDRARKPLRAEWLSLQSTLLNVQGEAEQSVELAKQALQLTDTEHYHVKSLAYAALGGGYRLTGDYAGSVKAYQQSIQNSRVSRNILVEMVSVSGLMVMAIEHGQLHVAYEAGSQALERLEREGAINLPITGIVYGCMGAVCYEWNQLERAFSYLSRGLQLSTLSGHNAVAVYSKTLLAHVSQAQGDTQATARTSQEAVELLPLGLPAWIKPIIAAHLIRYYLDLRNATIAEAALNRLGISIPDGPTLSEPLSLPDPLTQQDGLKSIISLRLILYDARHGQRLVDLQRGIDLAACLVSRALPVQLIEIALQALLLRAQMLYIQGNIGISLEDLRKAVELAVPEGYMRTFLDEGPPIAQLLRLALKQPPQPGRNQEGFIRRLLASSTAPGKSASTEELHVRPVTLDLEEKLIESLTDRERDVLRLMAEGLKYQEIAERLFITLNTVRFYVKEIYSKLGVNNRMQAIEAAHRHNIL